MRISPRMLFSLRALPINIKTSNRTSGTASPRGAAFAGEISNVGDARSDGCGVFRDLAGYRTISRLSLDRRVPVRGLLHEIPLSIDPLPLLGRRNNRVWSSTTTGPEEYLLQKWAVPSVRIPPSAMDWRIIPKRAENPPEIASILAWAVGCSRLVTVGLPPRAEYSRGFSVIRTVFPRVCEATFHARDETPLFSRRVRRAFRIEAANGSVRNVSRIDESDWLKRLGSSESCLAPACARERERERVCVCVWHTWPIRVARLGRGNGRSKTKNPRMNAG